MPVGDITPEPGRNVFEVGTSLEVGGVEPIGAEEPSEVVVATKAEARGPEDCAISGAAGYIEASLDFVTASRADIVVSGSNGKLEAVELTRVASRDVPHIVLTPRGRDREASKGRRVVTNDVFRQAVAVANRAAHGRAGCGAKNRPTWQAEGAIVEGHPVGGNERARAVNEDGGVVGS